jgi:hypothetical protein
MIKKREKGHKNQNKCDEQEKGTLTKKYSPLEHSCNILEPLTSSPLIFPTC